MEKRAKSGGLSLWPADDRWPVLATTIGSVLRDAVASSPEQVALIDGAADRPRRRWTYSEMLDDAARIGAGLLAQFRPGERLALWAQNSPEWILFQYGAALAGITLVTVNPGLRAGELGHVLRQSGAVGLACLEGHGGSSMRAQADAIRSELPALRRVLGLLEWEEWSPAAAPPPSAFPEVTADDIAMIIFTSGTTGSPKGAMLRHRGLTNNYRFNAMRLGMGADDVFVTQIPLFHVGGACMAVLTSLAARSTLVLGERISAPLLLDLIVTERATAMIGVPTMFLDLLGEIDKSGRAVETMRTIMVGGAPVPADLIRALESRLGARVHNSYGQTESGSIICATERDDPPEVVADTVGRPFPQAEVRIVGPAGETLPIGCPGELCVRGYQVMAGYVGMAKESVAAIDADRWLHTGDICTMDELGRVRIVGRLKEMIIRGGENLFPQEIESAIRTHPAVADVAVVGVPHARLGETAAAFVQRGNNEGVDAADLAAYLATRIAPEKIPEHWRFVESFPMTASGKTNKPALKASFAGADEGGPNSRLA